MERVLSCYLHLEETDNNLNVYVSRKQNIILCVKSALIAAYFDTYLNLVKLSEDALGPYDGGNLLFLIFATLSVKP